MTSPLPQRRGLREKLEDCMQREDWDDLFMHGGCGLWATILHEKLNLPMVYFCLPGSDTHGHVVVLREGMCLDYEGVKPVAKVAHDYAGWSDEQPRPTDSAEVRARLSARNCGDLIDPILEIGWEVFIQREHLYQEG